MDSGELCSENEVPRTVILMVKIDEIVMPKAAGGDVKVIAKTGGTQNPRVEAQKAAIASMKEEVTAEEKIACSIENPDDCVSCGS